MKHHSILIIGAGPAGLAAGIYAQRNGYNSTILESHSIPGGLCTTWKRKGYLIDGGVRLLSGTSPQSETYRLWQELGALRNRPIYYYDEFICFEGRDGRKLHLYTNIDRLEKHLLQLSPADKDAIAHFCKGARQFTRMETPLDLTPSSPLESLEIGRSMLPVLLPLLEWQKETAGAYARRFKDPLLREAIPQFFQFSRADFPMMLLLSTLAGMHDRETGAPIGGAQAIADTLAKQYTALGGQIRYRASVREILTEDLTSMAVQEIARTDGKTTPITQRANGVRLADGSEIHADLVISAADGHSTIFDLLGGRFVDETIKEYYANLPLSKSIVQVALGVSMDFSEEPPSVSLALPEPLVVDTIAQERLVLKHYCFDPTMAPKGKSVLTVWLEADPMYWKRLYAQREEYAAAKQRAADLVITALERRYPGLKAAVEMIDVATPATYERYTANWHGAFAGWAMTTRKMSMMMGKTMSKSLPGLADFYMIGQWVEPGGNVELSAASGRDVLKDICILDGKPFISGLE